MPIALPSRRELMGVLAACLSSMLGGTAVVATRAVIGATDPATLSTLRFTIGVACLMPLVLLARLPRPAGRDVLPVALLGVLFFTAFPWLFNQALAWTTAAHGSLALSTLPFLTLLVAAAWRAEALTSAKLLGVAAATAGVAIALSGRLTGMPPGAWRGDLIMIAAAFTGALYNVLAGPYLRRYPPLAFTAYAMLAGALATGLLALASGEPARIAAFDGRAWLIVLYLGLACAALVFYLWSYALERITPTGVAVSVALNPVVALTLSAVLLGEPWSLRLLLGLAGVVAGVLLVNLSRKGSALPYPASSPSGAPATLKSGSTP